MDILRALELSLSRKTPLIESRAIMPDGLLSVSDGVFYATLRRLGRIDLSDCAIKDRCSLLNALDEEQNGQ